MVARVFSCKAKLNFFIVSSTLLDPSTSPHRITASQAHDDDGSNYILSKSKILDFLGISLCDNVTLACVNTPDKLTSNQPRSELYLESPVSPVTSETAVLLVSRCLHAVLCVHISVSRHEAGQCGGVRSGGGGMSTNIT